MRLAAATIASKSHLAHARVLAASFREHHPEIPFFVLLADEIEGAFEPEHEPFALVLLRQLTIRDLRGFTFRYTEQELSYAAAPYLIEHLLDSGFDAVAFFKQESLVSAPLRHVLALVERHSIVLTPHLLHPVGARRELAILQSGVYNSGFLAVANRAQGRAFLEWWKDRLERHCVHDVPNGIHFEQRWLDLVPAYFDDYGFVHDPRFNVAHWNLLERQTVDPCFIRFSGYDPKQPHRTTRYVARPSMAEIGDAAAWFAEYARRLTEAGDDECRTWPYAYAHFDDGEPVPDAARTAYRLLAPPLDPWSGESRLWFARYEKERHSLRSLAQRAVKVWKRRRAEKGTWYAMRVVAAATWKHVAAAIAATVSRTPGGSRGSRATRGLV